VLTTRTIIYLIVINLSSFCLQLLNLPLTMKTAIVYDRVNKWGGAERVLLALHELFPQAPLYTSIYSSEHAPWAKVFPKVHTSFLQKIPFATTNHEYLAPLMPIAFESFDFSEYELVISVTSEAAKGIITSPSTTHICYLLTPTRYLWSGHKQYFSNPNHRHLLSLPIRYLRNWDKAAAQRPDKIISISTEVQSRIKKYYNRDSKIIFPPVDIDKFRRLKNSKAEDYYLLVSRLVKYKKVDLAIKTFNKLGKKLIIVGTGREENRLKSMANKNIHFRSKLTDRELKDYYIKAKALIFPQIEDFGIVVIEAQAAGIPAIAFYQGGAKDTVVDGKTGIFFKKQNTQSLIDAVHRFEKKKFDPKLMQKKRRKIF